MNFFDVIERTDYYISFKEVALEDCSDDFLTEHDLQEMGLAPCQHSHVFESAVKNKLQEYINKIPEGKKSILIDDEDLLDAMNKICSNVRDLLGFGKQVGNRLYKEDTRKPQKKSRTYNGLADQLMNLMQFKLQKDHNIFISRQNRVCPNNINLYKKLVSWDDIKNELDVDCLPKMRLIYERPNIKTLLERKK